MVKSMLLKDVMLNERLVSLLLPRAEGRWVTGVLYVLAVVCLALLDGSCT